MLIRSGGLLIQDSSIRIVRTVEMIVDEVNQDNNDVKMVEFFLKFNKYRVSEISLEQFCIMALNLMN